MWAHAAAKTSVLSPRSLQALPASRRGLERNPFRYRSKYLFGRIILSEKSATFRDCALAVEIDRSPVDRRIEQRGAHKRHRTGAARQAQRLSAGALHGHDLGHQFPAGRELVAHEVRNVLKLEWLQDLILDAHDVNHPMFRLADRAIDEPVRHWPSSKPRRMVPAISPRSLPGLTRQSIFFANASCEGDGPAGQARG